jgi:dienelactone hydrolase
LEIDQIRIPAPNTDGKGLEAMEIRPDDDGRHPLVIINHGISRVQSERQAMSPSWMYPQAREFARRGWTAVVLMRRHFGTSGGDFAEDNQGCTRNPAYYRAASHAADDIRAAIEYMSKRPEVDPSRIISVGHSVGGLATVALTADPPPGLVAGISFAGGAGSPGRERVCNEGELVDTFHAFGERSRIPMLWIYARNDHFFNQQAAADFYDAFTSAGGTAELVSTKAFGVDGHYLFSSVDGIPIWTPIVDKYLKTHHLTARRCTICWS